MKKSDMDPTRLVEEIEKRFGKGWIAKLASWIPGYADKKLDVAIEATASSVTRYALTGSP